MLTPSGDKAEESVIDLTDPRQPDFDDDRYSHWRLIGEGGTARVFRVFDGRLSCDVAIKLLKRRFSDHARVIEGLKQEVLISRRLRHPGIAAIHDFYDGVGGRGVVMDLVEGVSLKDWLRRHAGEREQTLAVRFELLKQLFRALELAHRHVVHRDLKPANVMLTGQPEQDQPEQGQPQAIIMDFGLALPLDKGAMRGREGTLKYIAPEQWLGSGRGEAGPAARADLFSMGVLAYEMFTGRLPMQSMQYMEASGGGHQEWQPEWQSMQDFCRGLPAGLDHVVRQMLRFDPGQRPGSASEVLARLEALSLEQPSSGVGTGQHVDDSTTTFVDKRIADLSMPLREIPAGSFIMGSGPESQNALEKPRRRLNMSGFRMTATVITNSDYRRYLEATGASQPSFIQDPELGQDEWPVVGVSWSEARQFAQWFGGDLPTEAQWEYAARCGEKRLYPWGDEEVSALRANIGRVANHPLPVNSTATNDWGLADMAGNVWEWCRDDWIETLLESFAKGEEDPVGQLRGRGRKGAEGDHPLRGGAYDTFPVMGRCAARFHAAGNSHSPAIGFRIVLPAPKEALPGSDSGPDGVSK